LIEYSPSSMARWLAIFSVGLSAAAQLLMKIGAAQGQGRPAASAMDAIMSMAFNPWVLGGLGCYGLSAIVWLYVLSRIPLSTAYPLVALAIALVVVLSWALLGESLPVTRLCGVALVVLGVLVIGLSR
jgi:drug/metabolite transporter (DMT)-like permease